MPRTALGAAAPAALALLLGLWGITREDSMWRDEAATWQAAHRTAPEIWHLLAQVDVVHGLYYLFMHGVFTICGDNLLTLRLPSVLAMAGAAAVTAMIGRQLAGHRAGAAAGFCFALIPSTQHYAQEGRSYAMVVFAVAGATWFLATLVNGGQGPRAATCLWAAYAGVMLMAALLNWFSLLALPAHATTVLIAARRRGTAPLVVHWLTAAAIVMAGALPLILISRGQAGQVAWIRPLTWSTALMALLLPALGLLACALVKRRGRSAQSAESASLDDAATPTAPTYPSVPTHAPVSTRTRTLAPTQAPPRAPSPITTVTTSTPTPTPTTVSVVSVGFPLLAVPVFALMLASLVQPLYIDRYILYVNVGLGLLIGAAVGTFTLSWRSLTALLLTAFTALLPLQLTLRAPQSRVDDVLASADAVARMARPGDGVVFIPSLRRDTAEVSPGSFVGLDDLALVRSPTTSGTLQGREAAPARVREAMMAEHRILVVGDTEDRSGTARDGVKLRVLAEHFTRCGNTEVRGRRVQAFERGKHCSDSPSGTRQFSGRENAPGR